LSRDQDALLDILEMIELIREHGAKDETALRDDVVRQAATIRWIEIIGEAANRVSDELRMKYPDVPWASMIGMRKVVAHGYDRVRLDIVWRVVSEDLSRLESQIRRILAELE
jgi:uncharacterized protein with HEPN domain